MEKNEIGQELWEETHFKKLPKKHKNLNKS